jgi:Protein of unknown function
MSIYSQKTFVTGVEHSNHSVSGYENPPKKVFKIQEAQPPETLTGEYEPLPENVKLNLNRVIDNVGRDQKPKKEWKKYFESAENTSIINNLFWYSLCKLMHPNKFFDIEEQLLDKIAASYVELFVSVELLYRDKFFQTYYDCLAQAVFYSFFFAYPQSRSFIVSEEFMSSLFSMMSEQITGMPVCNLGYEKWHFDLGAGNILRNKIQTGKSSLPVLPNYTKNKKLLHMRYSPLVDRYMKTKRYEGYNAVNNWKLRYTMRNPKQKEVSIKMNQYRTLAKQTVENTETRFKEFQEASRIIDKEILDNKRYIQTVTNLMEVRTQNILKQNPREYANLLVSLRGQWPAFESDI